MKGVKTEGMEHGAVDSSGDWAKQWQGYGDSTACTDALSH